MPMWQSTQAMVLRLLGLNASSAAPRRVGYPLLGHRRQDARTGARFQTERPPVAVITKCQPIDAFAPSARDPCDGRLDAETVSREVGGLRLLLARLLGVEPGKG